MKTILAATILASMSIAGTGAQAIVNAPVPVENYIVHNGLDWAWASPCAAFGPSCAPIDFSYQSTQGWRVPTLSEFIDRPTGADFGSVCASAYFNDTFEHCDFGDAEGGYIYDYGYGITSGGSNPASESWVVRGGAGAVPEPATWAMMLGGLGLIGAAMRRRREAAAA